MISLPQCGSLQAHSRQATPACGTAASAAPLRPSQQLPSHHSYARARCCQTPSRLVSRATPKGVAEPVTYPSRLEPTPQDARTNDEEPRAFSLAIASILNDTKCQDIVVLDVSSLVSWTSYMVFGSVFSKPQLMAALARVEKMAAEQYGRQQQNTPGNSPWECLDFGDCLLHVMSTEQREFYDIESFYGAAEEVELPFEQEQTPTEDTPPQWTLQQPTA